VSPQCRLQLPTSHLMLRPAVAVRVLVTLSLILLPSLASADLVKLMSGGELRGKILPASDSKQRIRLETMTGATVVVDRDQTQFVTPRPFNVEDYETRSRRADDKWETHWELSEWCRQRGLTKQREMHLLRVAELSPEHEKAQAALGRVWHQGSWVDRDELMASQGYVKYKNKYITPQELEVIEKTADEIERERSWFPKVRLWYGWLNARNDERIQQALTELKAINDPHAAAAVIKFLASDARVEARELSVEILVKISGNKAVAGLVKLALFDEAPNVRMVALEGIGREYYEHAQTVFVKALKSEHNAVVCRAANALGQIGDKRSIGPLIEALLTVHHYQVAMDQPANQTYSFSTDGSFGSSTSSLPPGVMAAVRTGQMLPPIMAPPSDPPLKKLVTVRVDHYNAEALAALGKLTRQNFGYDKRTWSLWWAAEKNLGKPAKGSK
jgi:hypothetical protein